MNAPCGQNKVGVPSPRRKHIIIVRANGIARATQIAGLCGPEPEQICDPHSAKPKANSAPLASFDRGIVGKFGRS